MITWMTLATYYVLAILLGSLLYLDRQLSSSNTSNRNNSHVNRENNPLAG